MLFWYLRISRSATVPGLPRSTPSRKPRRPQRASHHQTQQQRGARAGSTRAYLKRWGFLTPPVEGADLRAALEASCLRGACSTAREAMSAENAQPFIDQPSARPAHAADPMLVRSITILAATTSSRAAPNTRPGFALQPAELILLVLELILLVLGGPLERLCTCWAGSTRMQRAGAQNSSS